MIKGTWSKKTARAIAGILAAILVFQTPSGYLLHAQEPAVEQSSTIATEEDLNISDEQAPEAPAPEAAEGGAAEQPLDQKKPQTEPVRPVPEPAPPVEREAADWTNQKEDLKVSLDKVLYKETGKEQAVFEKADNQVDASAIQIDRIESLSLQFGFSFARSCGTNQIKAGDTFKIVIPETYLKTEDTTGPVPIYNLDQNDPTITTEIRVASYEIRGQIVEVTLETSMDREDIAYVMAGITIPVTIQRDALSKGRPTQVRLSEADTDIVLPPAPETQVNENAKPDTVTPDTEPQKATQPSVPEDQKQTAEQSDDGHRGRKESETKDSGKDSGIISKIRGLFGGIASFMSPGSGKEAQYTGSKSTYTVPADSLPPGFGLIKVTAVNKEGGYTKNDRDAKIQLNFEVYMDEDFMYAMADKYVYYPGFPQEPDYQSQTEWFTAIINWVKSQPDGTVQPLVFEHDLGSTLKTDFTIPQEALKKEINGVDTEIGSYEVKDGRIIITMSDICYFLENAFIKFNFEAQIDTSSLADAPQQEEFDGNGQLLYQSAGTTQGGAGGDNAPKYTVDKQAPVRVEDTSITYTIQVDAPDGEYLNEMTLSDAMPEANGLKLEVSSLKMTSVTKKANGSGQPVTTAPGENIIDGALKDGNIYYTFPAKKQAPDEQLITSATIEAVLQLDARSYNELIKRGEIKDNFVNQAGLIKKGETNPTAASDKVSTQMKVRFIGKQGKKANLEGTEYAWTIDLNTKLYGTKDEYLVDSLCWTDHKYDMAKGISITYDIPDNEGNASRTETVYPVDITQQITEELKGASAWENLTAGQLNTLAQLAGNQPFYYRYTVTDINNNPQSNPFYQGGANPGTSQYIEQAVMVIPYGKYKGPVPDGDGDPANDTGRAVQVKYDTDLNMNGLDGKAYLDIINSPVNPYTVDVKNEANLLWNSEGGSGPLPVPQSDVNFGKKVDANLDAVEKTGVAYDAKKQELKWSIDVNKLGINLTETVLTDELGTGIYGLDAGRGLDIAYYRHRNPGGIAGEGSLPRLNGTLDPKEAFGYTLDADGKMNIYLGDLSSDADGAYTWYTLSFTLKLTDGALLSKQGDLTAENTVSLNAKHQGSPYAGTSTGKITVPNTLVEKETAGEYDYETHELQWAVTINPNKLNLKEGKVTDTLEEGFDFKQLTKVEVDGAESLPELARLKESPSGYTYAPGQYTDAVRTNGTVVWNIGDGMASHTYKLYFTTIATAAWRNENLVCTPKAGGADGELEKLSVTVPNDVKLEGKVVNSAGGETAVDESAKAHAENTIMKKPISKTGEYDETAGKITWTVYVNEDQYNIKDYYIEETIYSESDKDPIHELDVDSIRVCPLDDNGNLLDGQAVTSKDSPDSFKALSGAGFKYAFQGGSQGLYSTFKITFDTYLLKAAERAGAAITNKVYLKDKDGNEKEESATSDGGFNGGFDFDQIAGGSPRPNIKLTKVSSNSTAEGYPLNGVEFVLKAHKYTQSGAAVTLGEEVQRYSKQRLTSGGKIQFLNIKTGNLIYVLEENVPAGGYDKTETKPRFIYLYGEGGSNSLTGTSSISYNGTDYSADLLLSAAKKEEITIKNQPVASSFAFQKTKVKASDYSYTKLQGQAASEVKNYENVTAVTFKVEPSSANFFQNGMPMIKTQYVNADAGGKITIKNLDAGTYLLTEVKSDDNMSIGGKLKLTASWNGTAYQYELTDDDASDGLTLEKDGATLKSVRNDWNKGKFSFKKYAGYTDVPGVANNRQGLEGVTFTITGKTKGCTASGDNFKQEVKSASDGTVTFTGLPAGSYEVSETPGKGYTEYSATPQPVKVYTVTISESKASAGEEETKTLTVAAAPARPDTDDEAAVYNTPIKGTVRFQKTVSDAQIAHADAGKVAGAQFGLYRKIGTAVADQPVYTAVSDANGKVAFANVEYGDYILKETAAAKGYVLLAEEAEITREMLSGSFATPDNPAAFDYTYTQTGAASGTVANQLQKADVSFMKKDNDGQALSGIGFTIYRRNGKAITNDGTGLTIAVEDAVKTYYPYAPKTTINSRDNGMFVLEGLPLGDYLLIESTKPDDLQSGHDKVAVFITIDNNGKAAVLENSNFSIEADGGGIYTLNERPAADARGWKTVRKEGATHQLVNQRKYGFVNVHKVMSERGADGLTSTGNPLKDVTFEVKDKRGNHYLTLKTDENGNLPAQADGTYEDLKNSSRKHLFYGEYTIEEIKTQEGYKQNTARVPFTIGEGTMPGGGEYGGHEGTAWISLKDEESSVLYKKLGENKPGNTESFVGNEVVRSEFTLAKTDKDGNPQSNAIFTVSVKGGADDGKEVASLKEAANGMYRLSNWRSETAVYDEKAVLPGSSAAVPYLSDASGKWTLLGGAYTVKETVVPAGYETTTFEFAINAVDGSVAASSPVGSNTGIQKENDRFTLQDHPAELKLVKTDADGNKIPEDNPAYGYAKFTVTGRFADNPSQAAAQKTGITSLNIQDLKGLWIAGETYAFKETTPPRGYVNSGVSVSVAMKDDGSIQEVSDQGAQPGITVTGSIDTADESRETLAFSDAPIDITIKKISGAGGTKPLEGAQFGLKDKGTDGNGADAAFTDTKKVVTAENGTVKLSDASGHSLLVCGHVYELTETKAPVGYELDQTPYAFRLNNDGTASWYKTPPDSAKAKITQSGGKGQISVYNQEIGITVTKKDAAKDASGNDILLKDAEFELEEKQDDNTWKSVKTGLVTDSDGTIAIANTSDILLVQSKTYRLTERKAAAGYSLNDPAPSVIFTVNDDGTVTFERGADIEAVNGGGAITGTGTDKVTVTNRKTKLYIDKISNEDRDKTLAGAVLKIYEAGDFDLSDGDGKPRPSASPRAAWTSSTNGKNGIEGLDAGKEYVLYEAEAPAGYDSFRPVTFTLKTDNAIELSAADKGRTGADGDISLLGPDRDGNYTITMTDAHIREQVRLQKKVRANSDNVGSVGGVKFDLYLQKTGSPDADKDTKLAEGLTTDASGIWTSAEEEKTFTAGPDEGKPVRTGLPTGSYYLKETKATIDTVLNPNPVTFAVRDSDETGKGAEVECSIENEPFKAQVSLVKLDEKSGKGIGGVEFTLSYIPEGKENVESNRVTLGPETTDVHGKLDFTGLPKGRYTLTETKADGYDVNGTHDPAHQPFRAVFTIDDDDNVINHLDQVIKVNAANDISKGGKITLKAGGWNHNGITNARLLGSVTLHKADGDDASKALEGVEFKLRKKVDKAGQAGFIDWLTHLLTGWEYQYKDVATEQLTGKELSEKGRLTVTDLDWGTYQLVETKAKDGYSTTDKNAGQIKSGEEVVLKTIEFTIDRDTDKTVSLQTDGNKFFNYKTKLTIVKKGTDGASGARMAGAVFELSGKALDADGNATDKLELTTDGEGRIILDGQLIGGEIYTLHEKEAPKGYERITTDLEFKMGTDGKITATKGAADAGKEGCSLTDAQFFSNTITALDTPVQLQLLKAGREGDPIADIRGCAEFTIMPEPGSVFADGGTGAAAVTAEAAQADVLDGKLVAGGTYRIKETKAPNGYELAADVVFTIDADGEVKITEGGDARVTTDLRNPDRLLLTVRDEPVKVEFLKRMVKDQIETGMEGTRMSLKPEPGESFADGDSEPVVFTTTAAPYVLEGKLTGGHTYTLTELEAPEGALPVVAGQDKYKDKYSFRFTVDKHGAVQGVGKAEEINWDAENWNVLTYKEEADCVTLWNQPAVLSIFKKDMSSQGSADDPLLSGCTFEVTGIFAPDRYAMKNVEKGDVEDEAVKRRSNRNRALGSLFGFRAARKVETIRVTTTGADDLDNALKGRLIAGETYRIKEVVAPDGFELGVDVEFKALGADVNGTTGKPVLQIELTPGSGGEGDKGYWIETDENGNPVILQRDEPVELKLLKTGRDGKPLAGAEFDITGIFAGSTAEETRHFAAGADGSIDLTRRLTESSGDEEKEYIYKLSETKAPDGYVKMEEPVFFKMVSYEEGGLRKGTAEIIYGSGHTPDSYRQYLSAQKDETDPEMTILKIVNEQVKSAQQENTGQAALTRSAKTRDESPAAVLLLLLLASAFTIFEARRRPKK